MELTRGKKDPLDDDVSDVSFAFPQRDYLKAGQAMLIPILTITTVIICNYTMEGDPETWFDVSDVAGCKEKGVYWVGYIVPGKFWLNPLSYYLYRSYTVGWVGFALVSVLLFKVVLDRHDLPGRGCRESGSCIGWSWHHTAALTGCLAAPLFFAVSFFYSGHPMHHPAAYCGFSLIIAYEAMHTYMYWQERSKHRGTACTGTAVAFLVFNVATAVGFVLYVLNNVFQFWTHTVKGSADWKTSVVMDYSKEMQSPVYLFEWIAILAALSYPALFSLLYIRWGEEQLESHSRTATNTIQMEDTAAIQVSCQ